MSARVGSPVRRRWTCSPPSVYRCCRRWRSTAQKRPASGPKTIDGPVALKVLGPVHKSEGGGVQLGLQGHEAVAAAYEAMQRSFGPAMTGALLQPMVPSGGVETIVGALQDPAFGPLVVFGLGGVTVEVLGDHVTRLAPLTDIEAKEMVTGLRGSALLTGYRGKPAVDIDGLVQVLHRVSRLAEDMPEVAELDCNPVIATARGSARGGRPHPGRLRHRPIRRRRHPPPSLTLG